MFSTWNHHILPDNYWSYQFMLSWRSILMCNKSTSAGTSLDGTPMFAHVTLRRTFDTLGSKCPWWQMRKQLLKDHNFLNNSPIFIIESSTFNILLFKKHCIQYITIWKIVLDLVKGTWHHNFMARCGSLLWANTCSLWSGIKSWPGARCLQRLVRRSCQQPTTSLPYVYFRRHVSRNSSLCAAEIRHSSN